MYNTDVYTPLQTKFTYKYIKIELKKTSINFILQVPEHPLQALRKGRRKDRLNRQHKGRHNRQHKGRPSRQHRDLRKGLLRDPLKGRPGRQYR